MAQRFFGQTARRAILSRSAIVRLNSERTGYEPFVALAEGSAFDIGERFFVDGCVAEGGAYRIGRHFEQMHDGSTADTCSVAVNVTAGNLPRIIRFSAVPMSINSGQSSTLLWVVENATKVHIDEGGSKCYSAARWRPRHLLRLSNT